MSLKKKLRYVKFEFEPFFEFLCLLVINHSNRKAQRTNHREGRRAQKSSKTLRENREGEAGTKKWVEFVKHYKILIIFFFAEQKLKFSLRSSRFNTRSLNWMKLLMNIWNLRKLWGFVWKNVISWNLNYLWYFLGQWLEYRETEKAIGQLDHRQRINHITNYSQMWRDRTFESKNKYAAIGFGSKWVKAWFLF